MEIVRLDSQGITALLAKTPLWLQRAACTAQIALALDDIFRFDGIGLAGLFVYRELLDLNITLSVEDLDDSFASTGPTFLARVKSQTPSRLAKNWAELHGVVIIV